MPSSSRSRSPLVDELIAVDTAIYKAVADTETPTLDEPLRRISESANYSKPWIAVAVALAVGGGGKGRRASVAGLIAVAITSAAVNQGIKRLYPRMRPDRDRHDVPVDRHVEMPDSTSFPSGHSASGFAFAGAVGSFFPWLALPLRLGAAIVAYSRVHTGVHYPIDAVAGSLIGASVGAAVSYMVTRRTG